jgi:hypothetical protein
VSSRERQIRLLRGLLALALAASAAALPEIDASRPLATARAKHATTPAKPIAATQATGRQPLAFVVHPTHAPLDFSWEDAYGLVTGSIDRWRPLDGRSARVRLVLGPAAAARVAGLWLLLGKAPSGFHIAATEAAAAAAVALDPASLGLITGEGLSPAVRAVRLAGVDPLRAPARYPLAVPGAGTAPPVITAIAFGDVLTSRTVDRKMVAAGDFRSPWRAVGQAVATAEDPGAVWIHMAPWNPFRQSELDKVAATVRQAKQNADVVIVYPHWGQEYTAKPNPDQVRVAHALIDAGADMIIATHPHWVQGAEIYKGRLIAYSLGNFVFDQTWSTETEQGAALELVFWGPRLVGASFVPVQIEDAHRPRFLDDRAGAEILNRIWGSSGEPYRLGS